MSIALMARIWAIADVRGTEQAVLLALADHAADDGSSVYPSVEHLGWKCGLSRRTIQRMLSDLRERGILVVARSGGGRGKPTLYRIDLSALPQKEPRHRDALSRVNSVTHDVKGVIRGIETASPMTPEPSMNHQNRDRARFEAARSPEGGSVASIEGLRNWAARMGLVQDESDDVDYVRRAMRGLVEDASDVPKPLYDELTEIGVAAWEQRNREAQQRSAPAEERYG